MTPRSQYGEELQLYCDDKRHLVCVPYSIENLHRMAASLRINRCWYHSPANLCNKARHMPHYDIPKQRIDEIQRKCILTTTRTIVRICRGRIPIKRRT